MKRYQAYSLAIHIFCAGLALSSCQSSSEKSATLGEGKAISLPQETSVPMPANTATPTPIPVQRKDVRIIGLMIGTGLDKRNEIKNPTSQFHIGDSIFAIVRTDGTGPDATIKVRCKDATGNVVFEVSKKITPSGSDVTPFTLASEKGFNTGEYHLEGLLDDYPTMAVSFEVSK